MYLLILLFSVVTFQTKHKFKQDHKCIHNQVQSLYYPIGKSKSIVENELYSRRSLDEEEWTNIRIKLIYPDSLQNTELLETVIEAKDFFERIIKVNAFHSSFTAYNCLNYEKVVVDDADLVLFVTNTDVNCQENTLAYVMIFEVHGRTKRPVGAVLNVCEADFDKHDLYYTLLHEYMHALGISQHVFEWINVKQVYQNGKFVPKIVTEGVVNYAREYFNCSSLDGIELESDWAHLKKRIYFDNIMSPIYSGEIVLSMLEFLILDDMNFYQLDLDFLNETIGETTYGNGWGCSFLYDSCLEFHLKHPEVSPFCFHLEGEHNNCTFNHNGKGRCNVEHYMLWRVPDRFRYIEYGISGTGERIEGANLGGPEWMDYCPFYEEEECCEEDKKCFSFPGFEQQCLDYNCEDIAFNFHGHWINCSKEEICPEIVFDLCANEQLPDEVCKLCNMRSVVCPYIEYAACSNRRSFNFSSGSKSNYTFLILIVCLISLFIGM